MEVIIPIGISGSGKSRLYRTEYKNMYKICPDDIRLEMTGNISDQSKNKEVFEEVDRRVDECIKNGTSFFLDATNLNTELRKKMADRFVGIANVTYVVLPADLEKSYRRITNDIENDVVRSNVPYQVLKKQIHQYKITVGTKFKGENVQKIIYKHD